MTQETHGYPHALLCLGKHGFIGIFDGLMAYPLLSVLPNHSIRYAKPQRRVARQNGQNDIF
ncbi:MAG: hypothetical protein GY816_16125 [Cytophagales bacterium]|nr:hypothetical protein [Cytophagales bacterium]